MTGRSGTAARGWRTIMLRRALALAVLPFLAAACSRASGDEPVRTIAGGQPDHGKQLIAQYGCGACHMIPGVDNAQGTVGPPLIKWSKRVYIAGEVPNTPEFLMRWIEVPQAIEPGTDMPNLGVTHGEARDIAAYLYTIR